MDKAIVSQNFGLLAQCLSAAMQEQNGALKRQWIFVPNVSLKQWLVVQLANLSPTGCIAGYKICTIEEILYSEFPCMPSRLEMRCLIYDALVTDLDKLELARHLTDLFFSYGKYGAPKEGWQSQLFNSLFHSEFLLPLQFLPGKNFFTDEPCHFFGFNALPPVYWEYLSKSQGYFYLFSPCIHFWEDVRSTKERARQLNTFSDAPRLLANLGKLGRNRNFEFETIPAYAPTHIKTTLGALQTEIVRFEKVEMEKRADESIQVFLTGSSKINEVETIGKEILRLCNEKGLLFSDILILAPNIQEYAPIVEYVFSTLHIPYRFPQIATQSSFYQGIFRLIDLLKGPWSAEKVKTLFGTASFARKMHLEEKEIANWTQWIEEIFQYSPDWEKGFAEVLKKAITLTPGPLQEVIPISSFDLLEKLLETLQSLQKDLCRKDKSLEKWALQIEAMIEKYLWSEDESLQAIRSLKLARLESKEFPFEVIEDLLNLSLNSSTYGNYLHAVCLNSIEEGVVVPTRACFIFGMDEESFPRKRQVTSLDLVKKEPDIADVDRYLFLQVLLNTKEYLGISYGHISPDDGKQMGPSIVVQELLDEWPAMMKTIVDVPPPKQKLTTFSLVLPEEAETKESLIHLSDLTFFARNPWKYYLQKVENISLETRKARSFRALRSTISRSSLEWPIDHVLSARNERFPGIFQDAFFVDVEEKTVQIQKQIQEWGKKKTSLAFYQTASKNENPPIKLGNVQIIGDIPHCMEDGALHFGDDHISSLLKGWPEVLATCIALQSPKVYFLKTGKIKTLSYPEEALRKFVSYYQRCQNSLSPLIPDWADALLRNKEFSAEFAYDDEVNQWIYSRLDIPKNLVEEWSWLKESFSELIGLYT